MFACHILGFVPWRPKSLQNNSLQSKCFSAINFVKITKEPLYKANFLAFLGTHQWQQHYKENLLVELWCFLLKIITKENVPRNYFVIISARTVCLFLLCENPAIYRRAEGCLRHMTPHCMPFFGAYFFWGGGGGGTYHKTPPQNRFWKPPHPRYVTPPLLFFRDSLSFP